jgi:hypothetical protein
MVKFLVQIRDNLLCLLLSAAGRFGEQTSQGISRHVRTLVHSVGGKGTNLWSIERIFSAKTARTNISSLLDQACEPRVSHEINRSPDSE